MDVNDLLKQEKKSSKLRKEFRYLVIIQINHEGKVYSCSNKELVTDLKLAKKLALDNLDNIKVNNGIVSFSGFKYIYADVPINDIIKGFHYEMQCIFCSSLTEDEIKSI